jgi:hypothetical protein
LSRSSRATGRIRAYPLGSPISLINTAAFESKADISSIFAPGFLAHPTITQRTTLPFLIAESGAASFTLAVMMIAQSGAQPQIAAARQNAREPASAAVIGDLQNGPHPDHGLIS